MWSTHWLSVQEGWGKFYPKRVIQNGGSKLSTQISDVKKLFRRVIQSKTYPKLRDLFNLTLYTTNNSPKIEGCKLV